MKKKLAHLAVLAISVSLLACGGNKKETASSIAQKWCELNRKFEKTVDMTAKAEALGARVNYELEIDQKCKGNDALKQEVEKEIEKCENTSEGK